MRNGSLRIVPGLGRILIPAALIILVSLKSAGGQDFAGPLDAGAFLQEIEAAERSQSPPQMAQQLTATLYSFVGRPDLVEPLGSLPRPKLCDGESGSQYVGALPIIVERARATRVVMINENHYRPEARLFWLDVLLRLRQEGYTHLAVEAVSVDEPVVIGGEVALRSGYYTREPIFTALLRRAAAEGYRIVAYDDVASLRPEDRLVAREQMQAERLASLLKTMPEAGKLIVLAGWSHVAEEPVPTSAMGPMRWMAARFKERTGIDPLTVDTTACRTTLAAAQIALDVHGRPLPLGVHGSRVDLVVHLPMAGDAPPASRWRRALGQPVAVPAELRPREGRLVVEAYRTGQQTGTLPYDRLMLATGERPDLHLPEGDWRIVALRADGMPAAESFVAVR